MLCLTILYIFLNPIIDEGSNDCQNDYDDQCHIWEGCHIRMSQYTVGETVHCLSSFQKSL